MPTIEKINEIFRDVFDDETLTVTRETMADDVDAWDSLMHVSLMLNIEKGFGVRFSTSEVSSLKNVGDLEDLIHSKSGTKGSDNA